MKNFYYILLLIVFLGCDSENALDCIQSSGDIIQEELDVAAFNSIIVWNRVQLILVEGQRQRVIIETGENLRNDVRVRVEDSILKVSDRNVCNYTRDYGITKVYVSTTVDSLTVRNSSGLTVENIGKITQKKLVLISQDPQQLDIFHIDGDFRLNDIDVGTIEVQSNGLAKFYLQGRAFSSFYILQDSDTRVEAQDFIVDDVVFFHRSTNKLIVNPQNRLRGIITGLGDVISLNRPPIVDVEERFKGRLIFE